MVRHWVLVSAFGGSSPSSPATEIVGHQTGFFRGSWSGLEREQKSLLPGALARIANVFAIQVGAKRTRRVPPPRLYSNL